MADLTIEDSGGASPRMSAWHALVAAFVVLATFAVFVPFDPDMPQTGLEPSWRFSMDQAIAQHLRIGHDLIFTFGPYASVYTRTFHPATGGLMLWGSALLAACYALMLLALARGRHAWVLIGMALFSAGFIQLHDARLFAYPLMVAIWVGTALSERNDGFERRGPNLALTALAFVPFGLLPLMKGSLLFLCGISAVVLAGFFLRRRRPAHALLALLVPLASTVVLWIASGQAAADLPNYFISMAPIISGYTEAMAMAGSSGEIYAYAALAPVLVWLAARAPGVDRSARLLLGLCFALMLFTAFKAGFVRHDGHAAGAANALVFAALLLGFVCPPRRVAVALVAAAIVWVVVDRSYIGTTPELVAKQTAAKFVRSWNGLIVRLTDPDALQRRFDASLAQIRKAYAVPPLDGTADLYSFDQAFLFASGNRWNPRPVMQSYSAYTPQLALLNEQHLRGAHAPDHVLMRVQPIDDRIPALEDGASWPAMLDNYTVARYDGAMAYLRKLPNLRERSALQPLGDTMVKTGAAAALPPHAGPLFARIDLQPTWLGKLATILFKPPQLTLSLKLRDGSSKQFRTVANMMQSGFFLSPLVQTTRDFVLLASGNQVYLSDAKVASLSLAPDFGGDLFWSDSYRLELLAYPAKPPAALPFALFDRLTEQAPAGLVPGSAAACDGTIDALNGVPPARLGKFSAVLNVDGWLAVSIKDGIAPDQVFITLTGANPAEPVRYAPARRTPRPDVKQHFKQTEMGDVGYTGALDVTALHGAYTLGLARSRQGRVEHCTHPAAAIKIERAE